MMVDITHEELLVEIERIAAEGADGATVTELMGPTGLSRAAVLDRLRVAHSRGRLIVGRKMIVSIDGRRMRAPCYKIRKRSVRPNPTESHT